MSTIDQRHTGIARRGESTPYLEDKDARWIPLTVNSEISGQLSRGRETIRSCRKGQAAKVLARQTSIAGLSRSIHICGCHIVLSLQCNRVGNVYRPMHDPRRETRHRSPWAHSKITMQYGRPSIGDRTPTNHGKFSSRSKRGLSHISSCKYLQAIGLCEKKSTK